MALRAKIKNNWIIFVEIIKAYKPECIICAIGIIVSSFLFKYLDCLSITAWSLEAVDSLFKGGFRNYSNILLQNLWGAPHGAISLSGILFQPLDWLISIWNLPVLLIHYIFGTEPIVTMPIVIWTKFFFDACLIVSGLVCYKIVVYLTDNKNRGMITALMLWGSSTMMVSIGYSGQNEIPVIAVLLLALYYTIIKKKNLALLFMALACVSNPAMIIFCLFLVISSSDKIIEMIIRTCTIFFITAFRMFAIKAAGNNTDYVGWFFNRTVIQAGNSGISLFAVIVAIVVFVQFFNNYTDEKNKSRKLIYALGVVAFAMCTFSWQLFYRFMICVPFMLLTVMIIKNDTLTKSALFGLCLYEALKTVIACFDNNCFRIDYIPETIRQIFDIGSLQKNPYTIITALHPSIANYGAIIGGIAFACGIWVLYVCRDSYKKEHISRIPLRVTTIAWTSIPVVVCFFVVITMVKVGYLNVNIQHDDTLASTITGEQYLEQYYSGKSASKALITIRPVTWGKQYPTNQFLNVDLIEAENGSVLKTVSIPVNKFVDNQYYQITFDDVKIKRNKGYVFKIYSPEKIEDPENYVYLLRSNDGTSNLNSHYAITTSEDGTKTPATYDVISEIMTI